MQQGTRFFYHVITAHVVTFLLSGCNREPRFRIAVSQCSSDDWRRKMNDEIMREAMLHDNVEIEIRSADDSNDKQIQDLDYFVHEGFDIILVAPNEAEVMTPQIERIHRAGIPVIVFDRETNSDNFTAFQGADNEQIARQAAMVAHTLVPDNARVIEIEGRKDSSPARQRKSGFDREAAKLGMTILASETANWNDDMAERVADSLLRANPEANIIYAHNDRMAIAAAQAAKRLRRMNLRILGIDAVPGIGIQAVADSVIDATFLYPTGGNQLINTALAILEGRPYERITILPSPSVVNSSNADLLLLQHNALQEETANLLALKDQYDLQIERNAMNMAIIYGAIVIALLLTVVIFLLTRAFWIHRRHRQEIELNNADLARQRDELDNLYHSLQEATGSKLNFFTNVSHDLRTPLTLIADPVEQMVAAPNLNPEQRTLMQMADKNVKRLMRLVNQILDIRKFDSGQLKLSPVNVDFGRAVREWVGAFNTVAKKHRIRLDVNVQEGVNFTTAIDLEKMERVVFNLLSNAFKFTPEGGDITVGLEREGDTMRLTVSDTGAGISRDDLNQIFDRFFMNDHLNPNGSGIGLALSKVFIEMHGGTIDVESEVKKGSTFTITLPVKTLDAPLTDTAKATKVAQRDITEIDTIDDDMVSVTDEGETVLVIDDNRDICTLIKTILGKEYTVISASSGEAGIRLARKYIPTLIICDVMMPGIDGYETCRRLKDEVVTSHIPVLLLTACNRDEQRIEGYECGADAYLAKPFERKMLVARCQSLIANRQRVMTQDMPIALPAADTKAPKPANEGLDNEFCARFFAIVDADIANSDLSVEEIADRIGMSRVQMYRKLKALTGFSPAELLRNRRLKHASRMLKTTEATISEIAYGVGFSSPSYFTKCYKDMFGRSPSDDQQWRKS